MLTLRKIAVTGGLKSGKSTVCRFLKTDGAYVVSADEIVHQLLLSNTTLIQKIINALGSDAASSGKLDRSIIAQKVFSDPKKLQELESILHPAVIEEIKKEYEKVKNEKKYLFFVAEVPLLYESESHFFFDDVIAVIADIDICKKRYQNDVEYEKRMARQLPQNEKAAKANYIITNNGNLKDLQTKVKNLFKI